MSLVRLSRLVFGAAASASLFACGGPQSPIAAPNALTRSAVTASRADLLYAATLAKVDVFSYPDGRRVGELDIRGVNGLCSDPKGDVFIDAGTNIYEYAHGGNTPIATVKSEYGGPTQCAFDPTTGNLAVIDAAFTGPDHISVYTGVTGKARDYLDENAFYDFDGCAYDGSGNLFVTGDTRELGELPKGSNTFVNYKPLLKTYDSQLDSVQWDGQYLAIQETPSARDHALIDRITIGHKQAKVVSRTRLGGGNIRFKWLYSGVAIGFEGKNHHAIGLWLYPAGGQAVKVLSGYGRRFSAVTISVAP